MQISYFLFFLGRILADIECCICYKNKTKPKSSGGGYEPLVKMVTEEAATAIKDSVSEKKDNDRLHAWVAGRHWTSIISLELHFHRSCYRSYTKPQLKKSKLNDEKDFEAVTKFVRERVLENSEILFLNDISKIYEKNNGKQISKIQYAISELAPPLSFSVKFFPNGANWTLDSRHYVGG